MDNRFMRAEEVADVLGISVSFAYKIVRKLNAELKEKGFITVAGKISRQYFNERLYGMNEKEVRGDAGV